MTSPPLERPLQASLFRPPITRLPGAVATSSHGYALRDLAVRSRSWDRQTIALPVPVTCAFWLIAAASAAVGGFATALLTERVSCSGVVCRLATLGDRPRLVLVLAAACVVTLLVLAAITGGLTLAGVPELVLMIVAAIAGCVSLIGVLAVVVLTVTVAFMGLVALVLLLDRD